MCEDDGGHTGRWQTSSIMLLVRRSGVCASVLICPLPEALQQHLSLCYCFCFLFSLPLSLPPSLCLSLSLCFLKSLPSCWLTLSSSHLSELHIAGRQTEVDSKCRCGYDCVCQRQPLSLSLCFVGCIVI